MSLRDARDIVAQAADGHVVYAGAHVSGAQCLSNQGETFNSLGRYGEARAAFQGALDRWEPALGPEHRNLGYALTGLGETQLATGEPRAAIRSLERACASERSSPSPSRSVRPGAPSSYRGASLGGRR